MNKLFCLLMALLCLASAALSEEETEQKAERVIDPTKPMIALTFDDGPSEYTQRILDTLEKYGCHATFCMVGNRMGQNAEAVAAVVASGNDIATHTWSHENLKELSSARAKRALTNGFYKITEMTGREVHFVRPPYGAWNSNVCGVCRDLGLSIVTWSIDTLDWKTRDAEKTFQTIKQQVKNGDIILCHDTYEATADAVDMFVPWLVEQGYQVLSLEEIFSYYDGGAKPGVVYYHANPEKFIVPEKTE